MFSRIENLTLVWLTADRLKNEPLSNFGWIAHRARVDYLRNLEKPFESATTLQAQTDSVVTLAALSRYVRCDPFLMMDL